MNTAGAYLAVVSARYRSLLQYRAAAFAGLTTQLFFGAVRIMVFSAFFSLSAGSQPMTFEMVVAYVWLGQALLGILPWDVDGEIAQMIRSGSVSYELVRPLDIYGYWYCRSIALRTAGTTLRSVPLIVISTVVLPLIGLEEWVLTGPASGLSFLAFLASVAFAVLLAAAITMVMHIAMILMLSGEGLNRFMPGIVTVLAGNIVPLPLFPEWLQPFLTAQPFRGLVDVPFRIYSGNIPLETVPAELCQQLIWVVAFILLGRWLMRMSIGRIVVQGG